MAGSAPTLADRALGPLTGALDRVGEAIDATRDAAGVLIEGVTDALESGTELFDLLGSIPGLDLGPEPKGNAGEAREPRNPGSILDTARKAVNEGVPLNVGLGPSVFAAIALLGAFMFIGRRRG